MRQVAIDERAFPAVGPGDVSLARAAARGVTPGEVARALEAALEAGLRVIDIAAGDADAARLAGDIGERDRDRHRALHRRVGGLELDRLDDPLVGHERDEPAVVRVGPGGRLAHAWRARVGQRDPERTALARLEHVDLARHAVGHPPGRDLARVEQRAVDPRARRREDSADLGRAHGGTLPRADARRPRRGRRRRENGN